MLSFARIHGKRALVLYDGSRVRGIRQGLARQHVDEAPASEQDAHRRDSCAKPWCCWLMVAYLELLILCVCSKHWFNLVYIYTFI